MNKKVLILSGSPRIKYANFNLELLYLIYYINR